LLIVGYYKILQKKRDQKEYSHIVPNGLYFMSKLWKEIVEEASGSESAKTHPFLDHLVLSSQSMHYIASQKKPTLEELREKFIYPLPKSTF